MTGFEMPVEFVDALAADEAARSAWEQAPVEVRQIYARYVAKPWSRRMRQSLAAETAAWAKAGRLTSYIQRPDKTDAAVSVVGDGCLGALLRLGL